MRILGLFFIFCTFALGGCAPSGKSSQSTETTAFSDTSADDTAGTTGYVNPDGQAYVTNGNPRVEEALRNEGQSAQASTPDDSGKIVTSKPAAPTGNELRVRVKEFQIERYKLNEFKPSRFGDHRVKISVFFRKEPQVDFETTVEVKDGQWRFNKTASHYTLSGKFTDSAPQRVEGELHLVDNNSKDVAHIFYSAYKAKLTIHQDRTKTVVAGSNFEKQLLALRDHTFGWVHNWMVVRGPAFYLVDIVKQVQEGSSPAVNFTPPLMAFKGESLQTGDEDHPAESLTPKVSNKVSLVGNSQTSQHRWFQTEFSDADSKETNDVIFDIKAEPTNDPSAKTDPNSADADDDDDSGQDLDSQIGSEPAQPEPAPTAPTPPEIQPRPVQPTPPTQPERPNVPPRPQPSPLKPRQPEQPAPPLVPGTAYLKIDLSLTRTARMSRDFARNRRIPGVAAWMKVYENANDWHHTDLAAFYRNANPFRPMIEKIAHAYDVSPAFAYVTVIESPYFTGGRYQISYENKSSAVGPFQILNDTADTVGMRRDERRYFAPSACGAARYFSTLVNQFWSGDTTVSILGYYQGDGGAARAIACTYANRDMCYGKNWSRYKTLAKNYNFTYAQIANVAAIPKDQRDYVNKKLAIYFISENIANHGFSPADVVRSLPSNGTVIPSAPINDPLCRQTISNISGI